jgi:hypothetical protein
MDVEGSSSIIMWFKWKNIYCHYNCKNEIYQLSDVSFEEYFLEWELW